MPQFSPVELFVVGERSPTNLSVVGYRFCFGVDAQLVFCICSFIYDLFVCSLVDLIVRVYFHMDVGALRWILKASLNRPLSALKAVDFKVILFRMDYIGYRLV